MPSFFFQTLTVLATAAKSLPRIIRFVACFCNCHCNDAKAGANSQAASQQIILRCRDERAENKENCEYHISHGEFRLLPHNQRVQRARHGLPHKNRKHYSRSAGTICWALRALEHKANHQRLPAQPHDVALQFFGQTRVAAKTIGTTSDVALNFQLQSQTRKRVPNSCECAPRMNLESQLIGDNKDVVFNFLKTAKPLIYFIFFLIHKHVIDLYPRIKSL